MPDRKNINCSLLNKIFKRNQKLVFSRQITGLFLIIAILFSFSVLNAQQQRFPKPEFETGYVQPTTTTPEPRAAALEYFDVLILLLVMSLATWFVLRKRSRKGVLWLSVFTIAYFGFYREGCICSVGSLQNIALSLFDSSYSVSYTVLLFFVLPLIFSLLFGRVFCAGACPLGALQDILVIKPISIPQWLQKSLAIIPVIYLSLAVMYAATGTDFIICRYDPFVGFFRLGAKFNMVMLGVCFLIIGLFVARPYCRFLCPYGVLLKWTSIFSKHHLTITPKECIQCKLCANSCPFDAIEKPVLKKEITQSGNERNKLIIYLLLIPLWVVAGGFVLSKAHPFFAKAHPDVHMARLLIEHPELKTSDNLDIETFMASGKSIEQLANEAMVIEGKFETVGWYMGGFLGFVIGLTLVNQLIFRRREDYEPNKGDCYSCARCFKYCPVK